MYRSLVNLSVRANWQEQSTGFLPIVKRHKSSDMNILFPSLYEELDMDRYAKLAVDMLSDINIKVALCDNSGQLVWVSDDNKKSAALAINRNEEKCSKFNSDG